MKIIFNYDNIISLGSNCYIKMLLDKEMNTKQETHFFDYIGTSMWSIIELFKENFEGMYKRNNYKKLRILDNEDYYMLTNMIYYIRIKHDFKQNCNTKDEDTIYEYEFNNFVDKYKRREKRFKEILESKESLLLIRYDEVQDNRINHYEEEKIKEYEGIKEFMNMIKINTPKRINFLLLSHTRETGYDKENDILILNINREIKKWTEATQILRKTIITNEEYLKKNNYIKQ